MEGEKEGKGGEREGGLCSSNISLKKALKCPLATLIRSVRSPLLDTTHLCQVV